jgi:hypothetical protein
VVVARGEEQHRGAGAVAAQALDHLEPVEVGHHDVEEDQLRTEPARLRQRLRPLVAPETSKPA